MIATETPKQEIVFVPVQNAESRAEGILPEDREFDASGNHLAVAVFDYFNPKPAGAIEIWRVKRKPSFALEHTNQIIDIGRGAHALVVAP